MEGLIPSLNITLSTVLLNKSPIMAFPSVNRENVGVLLVMGIEGIIDFIDKFPLDL